MAAKYLPVTCVMPPLNSPNQKSVAVIGAGWAGLAAAHTLQQHNIRVHVFEQSHTLGGRARKVHSRKLGRTIDNGQHLLIGAYSETLALMQALGLDEKEQFLRLPLDISTLNQDFRLCLKSALPAPLDFLLALLGARGLPFTDKCKLIRALISLKRQKWQVPQAQTVGNWLRQEKQTPFLYQAFWEPLCIATLNTHTDKASMQLFARVLQHSTDAGKQASDFLIPRMDLSALWAEKLSAEITIAYGKSIQSIQMTSTGYQIDGWDVEGVILATPPTQCAKIMASLPGSENQPALMKALQQFSFNPILTITLELEKNWDLPLPLYLLKTDNPQQDPGQWLFMRSRFMKDTSKSARPEITIVISQANEWLDKDKTEIIRLAIEQLARQAPANLPLPGVTAWDIITEKKATFSAEPGLQRLPNPTAWPGLYLAGDWTDTGFPGVLEGAVKSGQLAARLLAQHLTS